MASRSGRRSKKPQTPGMVNWNSLDLSDSDELQGVSSPSRKRSKHISEESAGSDSIVQSAADEEYSESGLQHLRRRSTRLTHKEQQSYHSHGEILELSDDRPRRRGRPKTLKVEQKLTAKRSRRGTRVKKFLTESESEFDDLEVRRSERTKDRLRKSMREIQEDEISENSESEAGQKVVATKEYFPPLSEHDRFRRRHRPQCDTCLYTGDTVAKGPLIYCQGCTNSYHKTCLGPRGSRDHLVTKIAEKHFVLQCRRCLGLAHEKDHLAPHQGVCSSCHELGPCSKPFRNRLTSRQEQLQREENGGKDPITIVDIPLDSYTNVMFRCATCQQAWHMHHLPKRSQVNDDEGEEEDTTDELEIAQQRFDTYRRAWICKDCIEYQSQIDTLVAWRPVDLDAYIPGSTVEMLPEPMKEYLVKWKSQSYFRTTWMPGSWIWGVAAGWTRISFMKKEQNKLPKMRTEDAIPQDFFRVDIVFDVRYSSVVRNSTKEIDLMRVKEVDSAYVKYRGLGYEDAIWEKPPSPDDTERWNDFKSAYEEFVMKHYVSVPGQSTLSRHLKAIRTKNFEDELMKKSQPSTVIGGEMMGYQMEGLNWLYYQWFIGQNAILADEMGLGKTIQIIAFFAMLVQDHKCWPFLVVVPNSTCPNWRREIRKWVPSLRVVTYYGSAAARKLAHDYELFPNDEEQEPKSSTHGTKKRSEVKDIKAHVVVTSYDSMIEEKTRKSLQRVPWQGLVVDEGQRLKNEKNLLYEALSKMRFPFKVLLTGTPLQNNARELFNLLQFLDPKINASALELKYETLTKDNVPELHDLLRPFFLRRTKAQVLTFLPPMAQVILPVTMSVVQKKIYKSILAKNPQLMKSIFSRDVSVAQKDRPNLNNILVQLRKTLCHPFVYSREIEERTHETAVSHRNLVEASSKLQLLSIMLPKLHERGHRVLLFSQFLDNLDILEDFLDGLGLQHRRLDGTINSLEKQKRIDEFNAPNSPYFAFLLSTRAGGVGINLATADTVIIMDPDFNPHQDIQALSRAHRIGQKNKVLVFQIMTRGSVEEKILQIGKKKMALDHVLIQQMDQDDDAGMDLESILRHGAEALFDDDNTDDIHYDSASVDKLLDRSEIESTNPGEDKSAESQFSFARIWANEKATLEDKLEDSGTSTPNPTVWDKILRERERAYAEEAALRAETLGRGKRKRGVSQAIPVLRRPTDIVQNVDYVAQEGVEMDSSPYKLTRKRGKEDGSDTDFQAQNPESENDTEGSNVSLHLQEEISGPQNADRASGINGRDAVRVPHQPTIKARPFKRVKVPSGPAPHFNGDGPADYIPLGGLPPTHMCSACDEVHPMGWCRLKIAGVEHCGLCGIAHVGHQRTCPHLNSEVQVVTMLETLKESTEERELVEQARKYLRSIRGDLVLRKRMQERKEQENRQLEERAKSAGYSVINGGIPLHPDSRHTQYLPSYLTPQANPNMAQGPA